MFSDPSPQSKLSPSSCSPQFNLDVPTEPGEDDEIPSSAIHSYYSQQELQKRPKLLPGQSFPRDEFEGCSTRAVVFHQKPLFSHPKYIQKNRISEHPLTLSFEGDDDSCGDDGQRDLCLDLADKNVDIDADLFQAIAAATRAYHKRQQQHSGHLDSDSSFSPLDIPLESVDLHQRSEVGINRKKSNSLNKETVSERQIKTPSLSQVSGKNTMKRIVIKVDKNQPVFAASKIDYEDYWRKFNERKIRIIKPILKHSKLEVPEVSNDLTPLNKGSSGSRKKISFQKSDIMYVYDPDNA